MFCPKCGKEIEEGSKFCKYCGAKTEEGKIEPEKKEAQQVRETVPSYDTPKMIPQDMLKEGEGIVFEVHPDKTYTLLPWRILGAILVLTGIVCFISHPIWGIIIEIIAFLLLFVSYLNWRNTIYGLTTRRIIRIRGIIGKDLYENYLDRIQDCRVKIGILQKMFGCGNIMTSTAGKAVFTCLWARIENPREVLKTLRTLLGR